MKLQEIVTGSRAFESRGVAKVKVTRDGRAEIVEIPVRSVSLGEAQKSAGGLPQAPKDGVSAEYLVALSEYTDRLSHVVLAMGMDVVFKGDDGKPLESLDDKVAAVRSQGFTKEHVDEILTAIYGLTHATDEEKKMSSSGS